MWAFIRRLLRINQPSPNTPKTCPNCELLAAQLAWMQKHADAQSEQVGMVLRSKFETVRFSGERPEHSVAPPIPLAMLSDVTAYSDEAFVEEAQKAVS